MFARAIIEVPGTHVIGRGLEMPIAQDRSVGGLYKKLYSASAMAGPRALGICSIRAFNMACGGGGA